MIDQAFSGVAFMTIALVLWAVLKIIGAVWRWLKRDAVRSLGRASGAAVSTGRKLTEEFREGFRDKS